MEKEFTVQPKHSANEMGSGDLEVLSTPSLIAFMENTAKEEALPLLNREETTVGIEVKIQHIKATAIGKNVRITSALTKQNKAILFFEVAAYEGDELIGKGTHKRAIVQKDQFLKNL